MADLTPNLALVKPGGGSTGTITPPERVDIDVINANMDKIDAAVGDPAEQNRQWYGPAGSIGSLPDAPKDGDTYQESNGNKVLWKRVGGLWVTNEGMGYLIRPTSVGGTGVTLDADGSIALAANTPEARVDGVFTTRFRRYRILFTCESASVDADLYLALRNAGAGVGAGQAFWTRQENNSTSGPTRASATAQNHVGIARIGAAGAIVEYEVQNPAHALRKFVSGQSYSTDQAHRIGGGQVTVLTACDGFSIGTQSATTVTGRLKVYGYA